jgi:hypothetical protein
MSHFAQIDNNNIVTSVIVADQDFINSGAVGDPSLWIQTSYNTHSGIHYGPDGQPDGGIALRKNYAGIGYIYDATLDAFYPPKPFNSWVLDDNTGMWNPPVAMPTTAPAEGNMWLWDENTTSWKETAAPTAPAEPQ